LISKTDLGRRPLRRGESFVHRWSERGHMPHLAACAAHGFAVDVNMRTGNSQGSLDSDRTADGFLVA
jgi:hypothetical protein